MENYELLTQAVHVDEGALSGPVVNSPQQLWSVAGYLAMVREGVFGVEDDGSVVPKLPAALVTELFGEGDSIELDEGTHRYVLKRPRDMDGALLVAGQVMREGRTTTVQLVARRDDAAASGRMQVAVAEAYAPGTPATPVVRGTSSTDAEVDVPEGHTLWMDGRATQAGNGKVRVADDGMQHCVSLTRRAGGLESLHGPTTCFGPQHRLAGDANWSWTQPSAGRVRLRLQYENPNGPINTGITAAVKQMAVTCSGQPVQQQTVVMPHSVAVQESTAATFDLPAGDCRIDLREGFNMSALQHFAHYTGGRGGREGMRNQAAVKALLLAPVPVLEAAR